MVPTTVSTSPISGSIRISLTGINVRALPLLNRGPNTFLVIESCCSPYQETASVVRSCQTLRISLFGDLGLAVRFHRDMPSAPLYAYLASGSVRSDQDLSFSRSGCQVMHPRLKKSPVAYFTVFAKSLSNKCADGMVRIG
jgi:hypothetical protein